jgi:hypothetical protein
LWSFGKAALNEGLAQSNNNAKFNYSAKHEQKLLEMSVKAEKKTKEELRRECAVTTRHAGSHRTGSVPLPIWLDLSSFFFFCPFFWTLFFLWANHAGRESREGDREE